MTKLSNQCQPGNTQEPKWIVLHKASGDLQRRLWAPDTARLHKDFVEKYGFVTWREGNEAHVKHRCLLAH